VLIIQPKVRSTTQRFKQDKSFGFLVVAPPEQSNGKRPSPHEWLTVKPTIDPNRVQTRDCFAHLVDCLSTYHLRVRQHLPQ